jgi:hypothetical protein
VTQRTQTTEGTLNALNFYSYAPNGGMEYHATKQQAQDAAEKALRQLVYAGVTGPDLEAITWGEVTKRAAATGETGYALKNALRLAYEAETPQVVDGKMLDSCGNLILLRNIHETDLMYHDLVLSIAVIWKSLSGKIERFKSYNFADITAALGLLNEKYNVARGGRDGNMTFFTFDRKFKLQIAIQKKLDFGPELQAAESKLYAALEQMTGSGTDSDDAGDLKTIVTGAFTLVDGKLRVSEVLRLRTFKVANALWNEAMAIVNASLIVLSKKKQIRLYERNEAGDYDAIPLDIAAL